MTPSLKRSKISFSTGFVSCEAVSYAVIYLIAEVPFFLAKHARRYASYCLGSNAAALGSNAATLARPLSPFLVCYKMKQAQLFIFRLGFVSRSALRGRRLWRVSVNTKCCVSCVSFFLLMGTSI